MRWLVCAHICGLCVYTRSRADVWTPEVVVSCLQLLSAFFAFFVFSSFSLSLEFAGSAGLAGQLQGSANSTSEGWNYLLLAPLLASGRGQGIQIQVLVHAGCAL